MKVIITPGRYGPLFFVEVEPQKPALSWPESLGTWRGGFLSCKEAWDWIDAKEAEGWGVSEPIQPGWLLRRDKD